MSPIEPALSDCGPIQLLNPSHCLGASSRFVQQVQTVVDHIIPAAFISSAEQRRGPVTAAEFLCCATLRGEVQ